jgi:hypothetical protein
VTVELAVVVAFRVGARAWPDATFPDPTFVAVSAIISSFRRGIAS